MNIEDLPAYLAQFKDQYIREIQDRCMLAAALAMQAEMIQRVFVRGEASDGTKIGQYKVYEGYFTKDVFVRQAAFKKRGKDGTYGNFKNGHQRDSMFFKDGWAGLRQAQGRPTNFKNYKYSGSLQNSIHVTKLETGEIVLAITDATEAAKRHNLELQDKKQVFSASATDIAVFKQALIDEVDYLMTTL